MNMPGCLRRHGTDRTRHDTGATSGCSRKCTTAARPSVLAPTRALGLLPCRALSSRPAATRFRDQRPLSCKDQRMAHMR